MEGGDILIGQDETNYNILVTHIYRPPLLNPPKPGPICDGTDAGGTSGSGSRGDIRPVVGVRPPVGPPARHPPWPDPTTRAAVDDHGRSRRRTPAVCGAPRAARATRHRGQPTFGPPRGKRAGNRGQRFGLSSARGFLCTNVDIVT